MFRIEQVVVFEPASNRISGLPRHDVHQTAEGLVAFSGPRRIVFSKDARVIGKAHYAYIFRRGSQPDPAASLHAERIR